MFHWKLTGRTFGFGLHLSLSINQSICWSTDRCSSIIVAMRDIKDYTWRTVSKRDWSDSGRYDSEQKKSRPG